MTELCRMCVDPARDAMRFNLIKTILAPRHTTRGAGGTWLCERCWRVLIKGSRRRGGSAPK
jgi:hypothetical protein